MRSSLIYVALLGATLALSATAQTTGCYLMEGSSTAISGCTCHSTCMKCGYSAGPDSQSDCVTCANGGTVTAVYNDGTGTCTSAPATVPTSAPGNSAVSLVSANLLVSVVLAVLVGAFTI